MYVVHSYIHFSTKVTRYFQLTLLASYGGRYDTAHIQLHTTKVPSYISSQIATFEGTKVCSQLASYLLHTEQYDISVGSISIRTSVRRFLCVGPSATVCACAVSCKTRTSKSTYCNVFIIIAVKRYPTRRYTQG